MTRPPEGERGDDGGGDADSTPATTAGQRETRAPLRSPFELIIHPDGTVTFVDLPEELLELALALAPDDAQLVKRAELAARCLTKKK